MSYLTSLDKYSFGTMFIITIELLYHAIMGAIFPHMPNQKAAYMIDFGAFCFFVCLMLLKQLLFGIFVFKVNRYRREVHDGMHDNELNENRSARIHKLFLIKKNKNNNISENSEPMLCYEYNSYRV